MRGREANQAAPDPQQAGASGEAVEQGQAVGKDAGGECAKQQIFQCRFIGAAVGAEESDQNIGGNGHQLEADKDQDYIEAGSHAHHAYDGKQEQSIKFAVILSFDFEIVRRHQDGNCGPREKQVPEVNGEAIDHHRIQER